jgi:hypothetical protein
MLDIHPHTESQPSMTEKLFRGAKCGKTHPSKAVRQIGFEASIASQLAHRSQDGAVASRIPRSMASVHGRAEAMAR